MGSSFDLCGLVLLVSFDSLRPLIGFHFFSFVGGSRVLSHRAYSGDFLFFVGSLLQRRKIHSDFVGLSSPRGGKGPYFSFLPLRPGLLLCSDLSFFCNHGIQHTQTHLAAWSLEEGEDLNEDDYLDGSFRVSPLSLKHIIGRGGRTLHKLESFVVVFASVFDTEIGPEICFVGCPRACLLAEFIVEMIVGGHYSIMESLARNGF